MIKKKVTILCNNLVVIFVDYYISAFVALTLTLRRRGGGPPAWVFIGADSGGEGRTEGGVA